jgi:hypothetical protein
VFVLGGGIPGLCCTLTSEDLLALLVHVHIQLLVALLSSFVAGPKGARSAHSCCGVSGRW